MKNLKNAVLTALVIFSLTSNSLDAFLGGKGNNALHKAVIAGNLDKVKKIVQENPGLVNSQNKLGQTPLMLAISENDNRDKKYDKFRIDALKFFLFNDANVNIVDSSGASCLHYIMRDNYANKLNYCFRLIASGANVNIVDNIGETVLEILATNMDFQQIRHCGYLFMLLLYAGAKITEKVDIAEYNKYCLMRKENSTWKGDLEYIDTESLKGCLKYILDIENNLVDEYFNK